MGCKNLFYMGGDTDRIYICAEVDDILLIKMIVLTYFFDIASVENRFCIHSISFLMIKKVIITVKY